ncbi:Tm-1-like ATP-binding domain-containing protein [Dermabacter sp. p3-SID358]|uniref:Tm-1-like ATP-binding domain-containing protein n=1 Tax=Dermabacter sp. p3-SID358 TaxID=2916114 RepID=UPI0021A3D7D6|nr:Tm-1-like ATP-binding domain-containing protein [Dermabacter sp. p3-SID358]MCT1866432.1 Tm-1-like ATP-binding domain-containing protein [Dermabacter sp. p3-SID358]
MTTIALVGTLDTKAEDYAWLKERLAELGVGVLAVDVGSFSTNDLADITADEVIAEAGENAEKLRERRDRGEMMTVMGRGAAKIVQKLAEEGRIHGILAVGGSGGSSVAAPAMQAVPVGFPKLLVSTMASGDVSPYIGETDTTIMYSVVDIAGVNSISAMVLGNAAAGIAGMAKAYEARLTDASDEHRPLVGLSMFGLTTPAADEARKTLTELGYEVLVFHATGAGGRAMEKLIESGLLAGVCDLTTTELADDLVGGVLSAGPERLEMAGRMGTPQVVSLGALDMVNFGPKDTVSSKFDGRTFIVHNPTVTLMRTSRSETEELGRRIGTKLASATGPTELFIPTEGLSGIDVEGGPFYDPAADAALFDAVKTHLEGSGVPIHERECAVNDEGFGRAMAERLDELIRTNSTTKEN